MVDAIIKNQEVLCGSCGKLLAYRKYPDKKMDGSEVLQSTDLKTDYWQHGTMEIMCRNKNNNGFCKTINLINI